MLTYQLCLLISCSMHKAWKTCNGNVARTFLNKEQPSKDVQEKDLDSNEDELPSHHRQPESTIQ